MMTATSLFPTVDPMDPPCEAEATYGIGTATPTVDPVGPPFKVGTGGNGSVGNGAVCSGKKGPP